MHYLEKGIALDRTLLYTLMRMIAEKPKTFLPSWLVTHRERGATQENPAVQNVNIIKNGFATILSQTHSLEPNRDFQLDCPVAFVTKKSELIGGHLHYRLENNTRMESRSYIATVQVVDGNDRWISRRMWYFMPLDDDYLGLYLDISSDSETRRSWEGNRLGTGLILLSHDVVGHMLTHLARYSRLAAKATIFDDAHGKLLGFKKRGGWTSHFARNLGYTPTEPDQFEKWYR